MGLSTWVSLIPLLLMTTFGLIELAFCIYHKQTGDIVETAYIWTVTFITLILIYLELEEIISFDWFFLMTFVCLIIVSTIYMIVGGYHQLFINMSLNMRVANILTFVTTLTTYMTFYGVENNSINRWVPLVPFGSSLLVEIYIIYILHQGSTHLNSTFSKKIAKNRIFYSVCIGTLFFVSVIHYIVDGIDIIIYLVSSILYLIGIIILASGNRTRTCIRLRCFKQAKWQQLKGEEMFDHKKDSGL